MGYQDRDYFREEHTPYLDLIRSTRVCWGIVIVIGLVFLLTVSTENSAQPLQSYLRLDPDAMIHHWQWHRLLTANFVADSVWHMIFALAVIWMIGHELEELVGGAEFFVFAIIATLISNLAVTLVSYFSPSFPEGLPPCVGPVGQAMALLFWSMARDPRRTMHYFFIPMPLGILAGLVLVIDLFLFQQRVSVETKMAVHLPSITFAVLYSVFEWRLTGWSRWMRQPRQVVRRPVTMAARTARRERMYQEEAVPEVAASSSRAVDEQLEAKLDAILEKVSQSGMSSLTESEKTILQRASEVMKRRKGTH
jgi:membrane associated rhomboid family serine protease